MNKDEELNIALGLYTGSISQDMLRDFSEVQGTDLARAIRYISI